MSESQEWYYAKGDIKHGPVSPALLKELAMNGTILPTDHIWKTDWSEWKRADSVRGLFPATNGNVPAPTPPSVGPPLVSRNKETIKAATAAAEQVTQKLWFLDLKFEQFATPNLIGFVFAAGLILIFLSFVGVAVYGLLNYPILEVIVVLATYLLFCFLMAVALRVFLECCLIAFRVADHLSHLKHLSNLGGNGDADKS